MSKRRIHEDKGAVYGKKSRGDEGGVLPLVETVAGDSGVVQSYNNYAAKSYNQRFNPQSPLASNERALTEKVVDHFLEYYQITPNSSGQPKIIVFDFGALDRARYEKLYDEVYGSLLDFGTVQRVQEISFDIVDGPQRSAAKVLTEKGFVEKYCSGKIKGKGFDYRHRLKEANKPEPSTYHAGTFQGVGMNEGYSIHFKTGNIGDYIGVLRMHYVGAKKVDICANHFGTLAHIPSKKVRFEVAQMLGYITRGIVYGTLPGLAAFKEEQQYYHDLRVKGKAYKNAKEEGDVYYYVVNKPFKFNNQSFKVGDKIDVSTLCNLKKYTIFEQYIADGRVSENFYHVFSFEELEKVRGAVLKGMKQAFEEQVQTSKGHEIRVKDGVGYHVSQPPIQINTLYNPPELSQDSEKDNKDMMEVNRANLDPFLFNKLLPEARYLEIEVFNPYYVTKDVPELSKQKSEEPMDIDSPESTSFGSPPAAEGLGLKVDTRFAGFTDDEMVTLTLPRVALYSLVGDAEKGYFSDELTEGSSPPSWKQYLVEQQAKSGNLFVLPSLKP